MTNFETYGAPRLQIGKSEYRVVHYSKVKDLEVYHNPFGYQEGFAEIDGKYHAVYIGDTAKAVDAGKITNDRFLVSSWGYDTLEDLRTNVVLRYYCEDEKLYKVIGEIDAQGYRRILEQKIGFYEHF